MARCIAVIGAPHVGKSTLVDRLAGLEGREPRPSEPNESRVVRFDYLGEAWTAIDCPGSVEFLQEAADALLVADAAVVCVSADPEQAVLAAPFLRLAEAAGAPHFLFVNRIDEAKSRMRDIVAGLQSYSAAPIVLRQIPIRDGEQVVGAVDLVSERAWRYREGEPSALVELPSDMAPREQEARDTLLESLSEFDDWLLEEIVEERAPAQGPLYSICARLLQDNTAAPSFFGSALHGNGVRRLMKALRHEAPTAAVTRERLATESGLDDALLAASFLSRHRKHVGKTVYLRAFDAELKPAATLGGGALGLLSDPSVEQTASIGALEPGGVAAAVKSDHLHRGRLYTKTDAVEPPGWRAPPPPMLERSLRPAHERDDAKLSESLAKLAEDDPAIHLRHDADTGFHVVGCQGATHLRALQRVLSNVFGVETVEGPVSSDFRETITRPASVHYRHKKQSGGAGQFADVKLDVKPADRGEGFLFDQTVKGGAVPRGYFSAVEAGAREALMRGPLGFTVVDVAVTLTDGQHHAVDSSDMAFRIAARQGVQEALGEATPVLLEPFYEVRFSVPSNFTGALSPLVSSRRGQVLGFDRDMSCAGWDVFRAMLPGAALEDLITDLRAATQGVGRFEARFDHYQELYGKEADKVVAQRKETTDQRR